MGLAAMCTVAFIAHLLGYMPAPGTIIIVPKYHAAKYSPSMQAKAIKCAGRYGITLTEGK